MHSSLVPGCYNLSFCNPYQSLLKKVLLLVYEVFENIAEILAALGQEVSTGNCIKRESLPWRT